MRTKNRLAGILLGAALAALALLAGASWAAAAPAEGAYSDTAGHWAEAPIAFWSRFHIVEGYNGAFRPDDPMTRAEMAKVLSGLLGLQEAPEENPFTDVSGDAWYAPWVLRCHAAGILMGNDRRQAGPDMPITREDAMVMLCRAFSVPAAEADGLAAFADAGDAANYARDSINALIAAGVVRGVTESELRPKEHVTRAAVIRMIDGLVFRPRGGEDAAAAELRLTGEFPQFLLSEFDGASGGKPVTLRADCYACSPGVQPAFQWYECDGVDGANPRPLSGGTDMEFSAGAFDAPGVRYFFCEIRALRFEGGVTGAASVRTGVWAVGYTGLPAVYIDTAGGAEIVSKEEYLDAALRLVPGAGGVGSALDSAITIKGRGNSTWDLPKKGYNFKFDKKTDLFSLGKDKKWSLIANYGDKTLLRNWFSSLLTEAVWQSGRWDPSYIPVDLVLNGEYLGSYVLANSIKIGDSRVDVPDIGDVYDEILAAGHTPDLRLGGFVLEVDARQDASHFFSTEKNVVFTLKDPDLDGADEAKAAAICGYIRNYIQNVENVLYSDGFADPETGYAKYLDVDSFADWYLVNELMKNTDARFRSSVYMYYDPADGLLHMGPDWDFDLSSGNTRSAFTAKPEEFWVRDAGWIGRLFEDPAFAGRVAARWNSRRDALTAAVNAALPAHAEEIRASAELNFARWPILGKNVWPNPPGAAKRTSYQAELDFLIDWLNARCAWLDAALNG